jgi:hypothetical protein
LKLLFHEMNRDLMATFSLYQKLSKENSQFKFRMFQWLRKGLEIKYERDKIMQLVQSEIIYLITEDVECFSELVLSMKIEEQMKIVLSEKISSTNMLSVYESIVGFVKAHHLENELIDPFKIEYMSLLLKFNRKKVMKELTQGKYPTLECLKLCQDANHQLAIAYLKERLGNSQEALQIYKIR